MPIGHDLQMGFPSAETAVKDGDAKAIQELTARQVEPSAGMVGIDLGLEMRKSAPSDGIAVDTVQETVEVPLALRDSDPTAIEAGPASLQCLSG